MAFDAARSAAAWSSTLCGGALTLLSRLAKTTRADFVAGAVDESRPASAGRLTLTCLLTFQEAVMRSGRSSRPEDWMRTPLSADDASRNPAGHTGRPRAVE